MGVPKIEAALGHLAIEGNVAASTQNQALSAILFLYHQVLRQDLDGRVDAIRAKRPQSLPTVLSPDEVRAIPTQVTGVHRLIVPILHGNSLRQIECLRLRVKDLDFLTKVPLGRSLQRISDIIQDDIPPNVWQRATQITGSDTEVVIRPDS
jgi:integrase